MLHQIFEQAKLARLQHNGVAPTRHLVGEPVEHEVADDETRIPLLWRTPAGERLDSGEELAEGVGLGEIIVAARAQAFDTIVDLAESTQDERRGPDFFGA